MIVEAFEMDPIVAPVHVPRELLRLIGAHLNVLDIRMICCTCRLANSRFTHVIRMITMTPIVDIRRIHDIYNTIDSMHYCWDRVSGGYALCAAVIERYMYGLDQCHPKYTMQCMLRSRYHLYSN